MSWALLSQSNAVRLGVGDERDRFCCSDGFKGQDCAPVSVRRRTGFTEYTTSQIPMLWPLSTATSMHLIKSKTEQQSWQSIFHLFPSLDTSCIICTFLWWRQKWKVYCLWLLPSLRFKTKHYKFSYFSHNLIWNFLTFFNIKALFLPCPKIFYEKS